MLYYKIGLRSLPPVAKVRETRNFKCVYLGTMILVFTNLLKNEAKVLRQFLYWKDVIGKFAIRVFIKIVGISSFDHFKQNDYPIIF